MANMHDYIDIYCERVDASLWSEPINALTNAAFFVAAWFAYKLWQKSPNKTTDKLVLVCLIGVVGLGSLLFHTLANRWSMLADMIPIAIFIYYGLGLFLFRVGGLRLWQAILAVGVYVVLSVIWQKTVPPELLNRSVQYMPALTLLVGFAVYTKSKYFVLAGLAFVASLTFRSLDMQVCAQFPLGIHFMWHILNGCVLYLVAVGVMRTSRR
jgi:hypothetical protein